LVDLKNNRKLIAILIVLVLVIGGVVYFGWYRSENQVVARCHQKWVVPEGDYYKGRDNFYKCLKSQGIEGFHGDGRFQWDKPTQ